jgi:hypothetical protein
MSTYSISPTGEKFQLPGAEDYQKEFERLTELVITSLVWGVKSPWSWGSDLSGRL